MSPTPHVPDNRAGQGVTVTRGQTQLSSPAADFRGGVAVAGRATLHSPSTALFPRFQAATRRKPLLPLFPQVTAATVPLPCRDQSSGRARIRRSGRSSGRATLVAAPRPPATAPLLPRPLPRPALGAALGMSQTSVTPSSDGLSSPPAIRDTEDSWQASAHRGPYRGTAIEIRDRDTARPVTGNAARGGLQPPPEARFAGAAEPGVTRYPGTLSRRLPGNACGNAGVSARGRVRACRRGRAGGARRVPARRRSTGRRPAASSRSANP